MLFCSNLSSFTTSPGRNLEILESLNESGNPPSATKRSNHEIFHLKKRTGKMIDASAKLRLLKSSLPKLKSRGHRVLLFSQFVITLNIVEDFLVGENYKFLRLDGNTPGFQRQKDIDEFNRPGSDIFIYLLTTRAGGASINLATADIVIVLDPDFNPHQDMQAIARSYRFGQTKKCLVFKMTVKYGVQALFESDEGSAKDIVYTDNDLDSLIEKAEKEGQVDDKTQKEASSCNLCGQHHGDGECSMLESSENLVEYREMLMVHAEDESWENRSAAIQAIDKLLYQRGDGHLLVGQPFHLVQGPLLGAKEKVKVPGQTPVQILAKPLLAALHTSNDAQVQHVTGPSLMTNTASKTTIPSNSVLQPQGHHDAGRPSLTNTVPHSIASNSGLMPRSQAQVNIAGPWRTTHTASQTANTSKGVMMPLPPPPGQPVAGTSSSQRLLPPHGFKRPFSPTSLPQAPNKRPKKSEDACAVCRTRPLSSHCGGS
ncbi:hypothetical protein D9758_008603 [Tetrapyrgos nigripes]|uniref:Helicase C-terminal domain-containing protein n=1 Tax=Tetrapyrgos nigripes TaxID=182062 RepID=A0A8H5G5F6_9AGAR|nr:hypothetical protein D9758_008603 [Tetrapyrgos nigripes]